MTSPEPVLRARGVGRRFGYRPVLRDVTLSLGAGEALLLTGPNGAGKTTLLRVLAGLLRPGAGEVVRTAVTEFVGHEAMVYDALTARENLRFFARLYGGAAGRRVDEMLGVVGLADRATDRAGTFSRGMLQRLAIARALLPGPGLLLLDEPLTGLDAQTVPVLLDLLTNLRRQGTAMIVVSHQLAGLDVLATRQARLVGGRLTEEARAGA